MGGSKTYSGELQTLISKMMKTQQNQDQQRIRSIGTREESVNRCLASLIHALNCHNGPTCTTHGCLKMKRVVEHTKTCPKKTRGCIICRQLIGLCCHHSKSCRQSVCHVPFCRIMKRKLQAVTEFNANQQSLQSFKPVPMFVIPPINPPRSRFMSESEAPEPKRPRLSDDEQSASASLAQEAQNMINNVLNALSDSRYEPEMTS